MTHENLILALSAARDALRMLDSTGGQLGVRSDFARRSAERAEAALCGSYAAGTKEEMAENGLNLLIAARETLKAAGATKTADRVRLAISSAKGAVRNAGMEKYR